MATYTIYCIPISVFIEMFYFDIDTISHQQFILAHNFTFVNITARNIFIFNFQLCTTLRDEPNANVRIIFLVM